MLLPEGPVLHSFTKHYKLYPSQCHSADIAPQNLYKVTQTVSQKQEPMAKEGHGKCPYNEGKLCKTQNQCMSLDRSV